MISESDQVLKKYVLTVVNMTSKDDFNYINYNQDHRKDVLKAKLEINARGILKVKFSTKMRRDYNLSYYNSTMLEMYVKPENRLEESQMTKRREL